MSTAALVEPTLAPDVFVPATSRLYRLSVDEYQAMVAAGVFHKKSRLHLIDGFLVKKKTPNPPHSTVDTLLSQVLPQKLPPVGTCASLSPSSLTSTTCRSQTGR